ncbi:S9 family peptidase [Microlunatus soli]|uniref:Dipeptidyl aminopeptidase/acylaminoacyl peptidase n=1 Tax=Microlunatus soli TaxID=630515 RepID=A0A1H2A0I0_9ACTN|nr:S9 family peptidase [Microlunatus soli]SDT39359.1 Dipeptidyl aminopeptidase/acylaminoacyl peptidase [Microlunatus soli]
MQITDLPLINTVSEPTVHPDGRYAVCAVTRADPAADSYVGQLWRVPLPDTDNGLADHDREPRRLTRGFRDSAPRFSPIGGLIAFLRSEPGAAPQLYVVDAAGGEPVQVTDRKLGVQEFAWSPDGNRLAFISREPEPGRYGSVEGLAAGAEPARRITTVLYQQNGLGYDHDRPALVYLVDTPDVYAEPVAQPAPTADGPADPLPVVAEPTLISSTTDTDHHGLSFAPDGNSVATIAAVHPGRDLDRRNDIVIIAIDDDRFDEDADQDVSEEQDDSGVQYETSVITADHGPFMINSIAYGPDGRLWFEAVDLGPDGVDFVGRNGAVYLITGDDQPPVMITDPKASDVGEQCSTIVPGADGTALVVLGDRGSHQLLRVSETEQQRLTDGPVAVTGIAAAGSPDGSTGPIVISYSDPDSFGDLGLPSGDGGIRRLTDFSAAVRRQGLVTPKELIITGRDGYPVHGWLAVPDGPGPFPALLMIHGGPFAGYGVGAFDEVQVLVDAGYAVAFCNPRGSRGCGEHHGRAIRRQMGTVDHADVVDFFDGALRSDDRLDASRTGILGGSYGGYLTAWTIAHDHRWAGAIVERGFLDPELFQGTSDIGSFFGVEYVGEDRGRIREQSPQAKAGDVSTPTLVLHSEHDLRCPLSQAERYYATLKRQGVDTELVIFPGENHELSRSGRPRHRQQRFEIILDWWRSRLG